jgi:hypothetical protein
MNSHSRIGSSLLDGYTQVQASFKVDALKEHL